VCVCVCGRFAVDSSRGVVTVGVAADVDQSLLDRESTDRLDVVVMATDSRHHSAVAVLSVHLSDVNDRRPLFKTSDLQSRDHHHHEQQHVAVIDENSAVFSQPVTLTVSSNHHSTTPYCRLVYFSSYFNAVKQYLRANL